MRLGKFLIGGLAALLLASPAAVAKDTKDTLTYVIGIGIKDWDPAVIYSNEIRVMLNIYETLTRFDPDSGEAKPLLATDWSVSDDGLNWTFRIREGVTFHDGAVLDAEAVKASLQRTIEMGKGASYIWSGVAGIEAPDSRTVVVRTQVPMPIDLIASSQYAAFIVSPKAIEQGDKGFAPGKAAGTGPYKLVQYQKSQQIVLESFADYWGGWTDEQFDRVIMRIAQETSTQVQMLRGAEADIVMSTPPADLLDKLDAEQDIEVSVFDSWLNLPLMINTGKYPTNNKTFRQALTHIMDYTAIAKDIYDGYASVSNSCIPSSIFGAGEFDLPRHDLDKARRLLEESGVPKQDWKVTYFTYAGRQEVVRIAELFQALAAQVGVEVTLETGEWGVMWDRQKSQQTAGHMFAVLWFADWPSPTGWLKTIWYTEDPVVWNFSHYSNPEYDKLIDAGIRLQGSDRAAASKKFVAAQQILHDEAVVMCLVDLRKAIPHRADVEGVTYNPAYETIFAYELSRSE